MLCRRCTKLRPVNLSRKRSSSIMNSDVYAPFPQVAALPVSLRGHSEPKLPYWVPLQPGFVDEQTFDRLVDPAKIVKPYVVVAA
jgi:hypothetical protein